MNSYLLIKSLHLIVVVSWMAGLLYLQRIFVYHVENMEKKEATDIFEVMEKRLFFYIMRPAMIFTWVFGLTLIGFEKSGLLPNFFPLKKFWNSFHQISHRFSQPRFWTIFAAILT